PHVEITRELARRFNLQYGEVFPEPEAMLTKFSRLVGLDGGSKMSKSLNNTILLSDDSEAVKAKLRKAVTDPLKVRKNDPGRPEICLVFSYHKKFNPDEVPEIEKGCRSGALGCVDCKMKCAAKISEFLAPIIEKRKYYEDHKDKVLEILIDGEARGRAVAQATMSDVSEKMKIG
ncbi:MAG TPA: tryptophan--tRNA ligase, partial [Ignavibacteriales bacterium]|nr:tryptophan--tRNA ligase [Ignavibacteriales bacterium]